MPDAISAARIRQLRAERSTAVERGLKDRITSIDKELAGHGYVPKGKESPQTPTTPPVERQEPPKETAAPADDKPKAPRAGKGKAKG